MKKIPRILLAAVSSNSGKTAAACGMMSAYVQQGLNIGAVNADRIILIRCFTGRCWESILKIWICSFQMQKN